MNEDRALFGGMIAIGIALALAQVVEGGAIGPGGTIGMCMVLLGIRGFRVMPKLPKARIVRTR